VKLITITVASPTAAQQTMQPASISENSLRSEAACISCRAQATIATTANTMTTARDVEWGWSSAGTAIMKKL
jgi:hypothetical protein